jgi:hypothetical protein
VTENFSVREGRKFRLTFSATTEELTPTSQYQDPANSNNYVSLVVNVGRKDPDADPSTTEISDPYTIEFTNAGLAGEDVPQLVADSTQLLAALDIDFGTSLGDLASLTTTGSFSPLATIDTGIVFGLDLNPSEELSISPEPWAPGPRIDVDTVDEGDGGTKEEVQTVTIRNADAGSFTLILPGGSGTNSTAPISIVPATVNNPTADVTALKTELEKLTDIDTVTVERKTTEETGTIVYTIKFAAATGNVNELRAVSLLEGAATDGQIVGKDSAEFNIKIINKGFLYSVDGVASDIEEQVLGEFDISVSADTKNSSLADLGADVREQINKELKQFGLGFFDDDTNGLRTGALLAGDGSGTGDTVTADVAPFTSQKNDIDFTLQLTQLVVSGTWGGSDGRFSARPRSRASRPMIRKPKILTNKPPSSASCRMVKRGKPAIRSRFVASPRSTDDCARST